MDELIERQLTQDEVRMLVHRLSEVPTETRETYAYPLEDLISWMREHPNSSKHRARLEGGEVSKLLLHFRSPEYTWRMLCGREGVFTVDPETLCAEAYDLICMN